LCRRPGSRSTIIVEIDPGNSSKSNVAAITRIHKNRVMLQMEKRKKEKSLKNYKYSKIKIEIKRQNSIHKLK
jgi:hypothetical protein